MKSKTIWIVVGIIVLIIIAVVVIKALNKTKTKSTNVPADKGVPKCIHEYPDGTTVIYPCGTVPPPQTGRVVVFNPSVSNSGGGGRNVLSTTV